MGTIDIEIMKDIKENIKNCDECNEKYENMCDVCECDVDDCDGENCLYCQGCNK